MDSLNYTGDVKVMFRMKKIKIPFIQPELAVWRNAARHQRQNYQDFVYFRLKLQNRLQCLNTI